MGKLYSEAIFFLYFAGIQKDQFWNLFSEEVDKR
jgi:hypothetical protein